MKKYTFWLLCFIALYLVIALPAEVKADQINNFDIQVKVQENGVLSITQKIEYQFEDPHHGIYATIPQEYEMEIEGEMRNYHFPVCNVNVRNFPYETNDGDNFLIRIGDPDSYVSGVVHYEYSYDIVTGDLGLTDHKQMFYFNLVGDGWTVPIYHVDFAIEFSKEVLEDPYFYGTSEASLSGIPEQVDYVKEGNTIRGEYPLTIVPGKAFTVLQHLPDEYFTFPDHSDQQLVLGIVLCVAALIIVGLYMIFGRDEPIASDISPYPPEGISSMILSYLIYGRIKKKAIVSLFSYWASRGYLRIIEEKDGIEITFQQLLWIPRRENEYEREIFNAAFSGNHIVQGSRLPIAYLEASAEAKSNKHKLFTSKKTLYHKMSVVLQAVSGIVFSVLLGGYVGLHLRNYAVSEIHSLLGFALGVGVFLFVSLILFLMLHNKVIRSKANFFVKTVIGSILIVVILFGFGILLYQFGEVTLLSMSLVMGALLVSAVCVPFMRKRSVYGMKLYGEVLGFCEFILQAKKDQLEDLVKKNPWYFYDILPYAYVLGASGRWIKQFEDIQMEQPNWYETWYPMTNITFFHAMVQDLDLVKATAATKSMQSRGGGAFYSDGGFGDGGGGSDGDGGGFGGGGSDGGGSSGGGAGGGGGGSW